VKLIRASAKRFCFHLGRREMSLLRRVLALYPRIPSAYQRLTKSAAVPDGETSQRLLDEALAEQRAENKQRLSALLEDSKRLVEDSAGWRLALSPGDFEWLLQVLNDVRIGSWVVLGSPEERVPEVTEKTAPDIWAMEMAGAFQMGFLEEVEGLGDKEQGAR